MMKEPKRKKLPKKEIELIDSDIAKNKDLFHRILRVAGRPFGSSVLFNIESFIAMFNNSDTHIKIDTISTHSKKVTFKKGKKSVEYSFGDIANMIGEDK